MIDIDITLGIQFVNFIITLVVLQIFLIAPVREQLKKRRSAVADLSDEIQAFIGKADAELTGYEATLKAAREAAGNVRNAARAEAEEQSLAMLAKATADAQNEAHAAQNAMKAEVAEAKSGLEKDMDAFTRAALSKLVG